MPNNDKTLNTTCMLDVAFAPIRLASGNGYSSGRLEVNYLGIWGTVCDDGFGSPDAQVVCKQLGFPSVSSYSGNAYYGQGSGDILLDDLGCSGSEYSIANCTRYKGKWRSHNCGHSEDVGVSCASNNDYTSK